MAMFSVVLLTAAPPGLGNEIGGAFVKIDGRESLLRSVELFLNRDNIKQLQLVVSNEAAEEAKRKYGAHLGFSGVKLVVSGSKWSEQLCAAAANISTDATHVIVHDAARPAVPYNDLDLLLSEAEKHPAVALATPNRSPLLELDDADQPVAQHLPSRFVLMQTPLAMTRAKFVESAASSKDLHASEWTLLRGSVLNIRLGAPGDERLVKAMLNLLPRPKIKAPDNPFSEAQW